MRKLSAIVGTLALLALTNCGGTPASTTAGQTALSQVAATVSASVLPANVVATLQRTCQASSALLNAGAASANATISGTAVDAAAYCNQLGAAPVGQVPATTDTNTASWLPGVIAGVQAAAQIAGVVLPALAAL